MSSTTPNNNQYTYPKPTHLATRALLTTPARTPQTHSHTITSNPETHPLSPSNPTLCHPSNTPTSNYLLAASAAAAAARQR